MSNSINENDMKKVTGGSGTIDNVDYTPTDDIDDETKEKVEQRGLSNSINENDMKKVTGGNNKTIDDVIYTPTEDIDDDTKEKVKK